VFDEAAMQGSSVQIITDAETLYKAQVEDSRVDNLTKALLRGYEGLWTSPVQISESRLSRFLNRTEKEVMDQLALLHKKGIINYRRPSAKNQITLLKERVPEENFTIDMKSYSFRKEKAIARMKAMISYLGDEVECREVFLRKYFGETNCHPCGHCDKCRRTKSDTSRMLKINDTLREHDGITVKDFLAQYQTGDQAQVKNELRQLVDENKIRIIEDKIFQKR
jgi:ATP-dependent DNA helicase RecQ